jgi:hypothetical protein
MLIGVPQGLVKEARYCLLAHADVVTFCTSSGPLLSYQQKRKKLYRERIVAYKGVPRATYLDVMGFVLDAQINAQNGDPESWLKVDPPAGI